MTKRVFIEKDTGAEFEATSLLIPNDFDKAQMLDKLIIKPITKQEKQNFSIDIYFGKENIAPFSGTTSFQATKDQAVAIRDFIQAGISYIQDPTPKNSYDAGDALEIARKLMNEKSK